MKPSNPSAPGMSRPSGRLASLSPAAVGAGLFYCLMAVIGPWVGLLIVCLKCLSPISFTEEQKADLTEGGKFWVHLERDIPIYVSAVVLMLLIILMVPWRKSLQSTRQTGLRVLAALGGILMVAPVPFWTKGSVISYSQTTWAIPVLFFFLALCLTGSCFWLLHVQRESGGSDAFPGAAFRIEPPKSDRKDIAVLVFLSVLIFVPQAEYLAGRFFQIEELNHWNAFVISAALALKHGAALYRDFTPIYGAGWPTLLGYLAPYTGINYAHVIRFSMLFSICYFLVFYFFLRFFFKGRFAAFAFTLLCCVISDFPSVEPETKSIIWRWMGGGIIRSPADLPFLIFLARFCLHQRRVDAVLLGASLGIAFLFTFDVGVFLLATALVTWLLLLFVARTTRRLGDCFWCFGTALVTAFAGLSIATRGAILESRTLGSLFDYIRRATGGEGMIPFADLKPVWVLLFSIIVLLLLGLAGEFVRRLRSGLSHTDVFLAAAALYPLQRMVYFMGRTHWCALASLAAPILIGIAVLLNATVLQPPADKESAEAPHNRTERREFLFALAAIFVSVFLFCFSGDPPNYPAFWNAEARAELTAHGVTVRPEERDITGLPPQYAQYAAAFHTVARKMRELHHSGLSVRFMDACSTTMYVCADIPPFGKDVFEFDRADTSRKEIKKLVADLALAKADVVVFNRVQFPWPRVLSLEAWQTCRDAMFDHYRRGEEYGPFEFWYRRDAKVPL
jgi:hypothetical protein